MQKKWSHIDSHLIGPLDEKEVSLKVNSAISSASPPADCLWACNYMSFFSSSKSYKQKQIPKIPDVSVVV